MPIQSSNIKDASWSNGTLTVVFHNGMVYEYDDVPLREFVKMRAAKSVGAYFHANIRLKYKYRRVQDV